MTSITKALGHARRNGGFFKNFFDAKVGWDALKHGSAGVELVGEDQLGNKYYQDFTQQNGRHRWVSYGDVAGDYTPSSVPPEWHSWLHVASDKTGPEVKAFSPTYEVAHYVHPSGTPACYKPKGGYFNEQKFNRSWAKYEAWVPPGGK